MTAPIVDIPSSLEGETVSSPPLPLPEKAVDNSSHPSTSPSVTQTPSSAPIEPKPETPVPSPAVSRPRRSVTPVDYLKLNDGPQKTLKSMSAKPKSKASSTSRALTLVTETTAQGEMESGSAENSKTQFCFAVEDEDSPQSVDEVKRRSDWPLWSEAMDREMSQLEKLGTYTLVDLPPDRKAIGCRWVFAVKRDSDGKVVKHKARLVAQGFSQIPGQDFFATHAPVMRLETFRTIIAIAAQFDLNLHQVDVVSAYLNSPLHEDIYMRQAPGYEDGTSRVYHLHKALYGLKQAGRAWRIEFDRVLINALHFTRSQADPCLYYRTSNEDLTLIGTHVDDCLVASTDLDVISDLKRTMKKYFEITDLGEAALYVGIQITRHRNQHTITLSQSRYVKTVIDRFGMTNCNPVSTPLDANVVLAPAESNSDLVSDVPYQALIGSLMYAAVGTRPDIAFAVQALSQFNASHTAAHWTAARHVLRYLKRTCDFGITFGKTPELILSGFSDADWGQNKVDRRSVSGYTFLLGGGIVSWSSKKQSTVALSTMEAEYVALAHATKEAIWFRSLLGELGLLPDGPTLLTTDNLAAISFAQDHQFHARSKHIDIRHYFVRERVLDSTIRITHCSSEDNCADILTKPLGRIIHEKQLALINLASR